MNIMITLMNKFLLNKYLPKDYKNEDQTEAHYSGQLLMSLITK